VNQVNYAIFGGSFNPVHNGHIIIVHKMLEYLKQLKKLFIVPAGCSPFKRDMKDQASFEDRYTWCYQAFSGISRTDILDIERDDGKNSPSFTYETIEQFYQSFGEYPTLIIGEDALTTFHKWKQHEKILERCEIAVFRRRGYSENHQLNKRFLHKITVYDSPYIEISSTEIRNRISHGQSIRGYVPETLEEPIIQTYESMRDHYEQS